jgi:cytochrome c oxidase subunit 2
LGWIFGLLVLGIGTYTWAAIQFFNMYRPSENSLDIYVVGLQWMWKFQHLEGTGEINTLHVPQGRPVRLVMTSEDVIHSFYVPAFRLKHDVIPGRYTNLYFEATQTGDFPIYCTEYCGTDHSRMIGHVIVMEPQRYQEWLSGAVREPRCSANAGGS